MSKIIANAKSVWSVCSSAAGKYMNAAKRELKEFEQGYEAAEAYWRANPDARPEFLHNVYHM